MQTALTWRHVRRTPVFHWWQGQCNDLWCTNTKAGQWSLKPAVGSFQWCGGSSTIALQALLVTANPPPLHKLLSLQGAQDIMSTAAGTGSTVFDEMQGKATWLQGKFLQWQAFIAWKCHRNNISLWSISGFSASHFSLEAVIRFQAQPRLPVLTSHNCRSRSCYYGSQWLGFSGETSHK